MSSGYYRSIPGSRELITGTSSGSPEVTGEDGLGPVKLGSDSVLLPSWLLDELMPSLGPVEQSALLSLAILALKDGNNYCRVGKPELIRRVNVSDRRLHVALSLLAQKGHIELLHRDNGGTLYKLNIIDTIKTTDSIKKRKPKKARSKKRVKPLLAPLSEDSMAGPDKGGRITIRMIADEFYLRKKKKPTDIEMDAAIGEITALLEDGFTREEVRKAIVWYVGSESGAKDLSRLAYHINEALAVD